MNLLEIVKELFAYLVRFREKAPTTAAPPWHEVQSDLVAIFARMETKAKAHPTLKEPYRQVRYALVALADEVILNSGWEYAKFWRDSALEKYYFGTREGSQRFFELAGQLDHAPVDVAGVFYLCLALGFCGRYAPDDPELREIKERLKARLPQGKAEGPDWAQERNRPQANPKSQPNPPRRRGWLWVPALGAALVAAIFASRHLDFWTPSEPVSPKPGISSPKPEKTLTTTTSTTPIIGTGPTMAVMASSTTAPPPQVMARATVTTLPAPPPSVTTTPAPRPAPPAATALARPTAEERTYRLQVGVFVGPIQSGRLAEELKKLGLPAKVVELPKAEGKVLYLVVVEPIAGIDQAKAAQQAIKEKFKIQTILRSLK